MLENYLIKRVIQTFDYTILHWAGFFIYTFIGLLVALLPLDVLNKEHWMISTRLELIPFVLGFFLVGSFYLLKLQFVLEFIQSIQIYSNVVIMLSQIMFGYTVMQFFIKK